ncbi:MAG: hypothetical protein E7Z93_02855 [Cyanobacteria bacterium SIG32]|nr:hypothetical protein [Cyanobacteria bacterium SIG32]
MAKVAKQVQDDNTVVQDDGMILRKPPKPRLGERFYPPPDILKPVVASFFNILRSPFLLDFPTLMYFLITWSLKP